MGDNCEFVDKSNTYSNRNIDWLLEQLKSKILFCQKVGLVEFLPTLELPYGADSLTLHVQTDHIDIQVKKANLSNTQPHKSHPF